MRGDAVPGPLNGLIAGLGGGLLVGTADGLARKTATIVDGSAPGFGTTVFGQAMHDQLEEYLLSRLAPGLEIGS
jgi:hypothetical protein